MDLDINKVTVAQLKRWLECLNLSTKGSKADLYSRICAIPPESRGSAPMMNQVEEEQESLDEEAEGAAVEKRVKQNRTELARGMATMEELHREIEKARKVLENLQQQIDSVSSRISDARPSGARNDMSEHNGDMCDRDGERSNGAAEDVRRSERDGERSEANEAERNERDASENSGNFGRNDDGQNASSDANSGRGVRDDFSSAGFGLAKEILLDFSENMSVRAWVSQWENVARLYKLTDTQSRVLLIGKLKGSALQWLHADATRFGESTSELVDQLLLAFGGNESKAELRRKFEARLWKPTEKFAVYFEEKRRLAREVNMEDDELLDGLIVGIPAINLRNQAKLQCFENPGRMLKAFANIMLPVRAAGEKKMHNAKDELANKETRCYNCNGKGHWARDCIKSKRTPGSCYGCGAMDHMISKCPQNKKDAANNYNA
ncbi:uncharacterized protein [Drosophila kikkawai]|uniref:CCHC-type domain-containing protein n=1 Tax=Drosophila kikkawai TaxID=30033 RepID=A0A6P4IQT5_DROKI